jgi:hypothetical protein
VCVCVCVCVSLVAAIQPAKRLPFILLSYAICLAVPYYFMLFHKRQDFRGGGGVMEAVEHKCVFNLLYSTNLVWQIPRYKKNWVKYCHKWT